jgi:serine/threonine protein kinase
MHGGILFNRVTQRQKYDEKMSAQVLRQIIMALLHIHSKGILHRDIKLENIFMVKLQDDIQIKLGDFDLSCEISKADESRVCGTAGYIAPEIFNYERRCLYSTKSDVYACGIMLYSLLFGKLPYDGKSTKQLLEQNRDGGLIISEENMKSISRECADLIWKMTRSDPKERISCEEVLAHPFMARYSIYFVLIERRLKIPPKMSEENFGEEEMSEIATIGASPMFQIAHREMFAKFFNTEGMPQGRSHSFNGLPRTQSSNALSKQLELFGKSSEALLSQFSKSKPM